MDGYDTTASISSCGSSDSSLVVWLHEELADGTTRTTTMLRSMDTLKVLFEPPPFEGGGLKNVLGDRGERRLFWKGIRKVRQHLKSFKNVPSPHASVLASLRDKQLIVKQVRYFEGLDVDKQTELISHILSASSPKASHYHYNLWFEQAICIVIGHVGAASFTKDLLLFIVGTLDTRHKMAVLAEGRELASTNKLYFDYESHSFGKFSPEQMKNMLSKRRDAASATKDKKGEKQEEGDGADIVEPSKSADEIHDLRICNSIYDTPAGQNIVICGTLQIFDGNESVQIESTPPSFIDRVIGFANVFGFGAS